MIRILFIGDTWEGSSARSLREALALQPGALISEVGRDHYLPIHRRVTLRAANRLLRVFQVYELEDAIRQARTWFHPDVVVVYKGVGIRRRFIQEIQQLGIPIVNIFPDLSPNAHGKELAEAMGHYDLVISTKPFHPRSWRTIYGYRNTCVCVPHGYSPQLHLREEPPRSQLYDVALCATWRSEYHRLMRAVAEELGGDSVSVAIAGGGWTSHRNEFPQHWSISGPVIGRAFVEFLRSSKIQVAPVNREMVIRGTRHPGDEDTTRTYQLAAAHCFFLHQRTDFVATIYDQQTEVPLWGNAAELVKLIRKWLPNEHGRQAMAAKAHARAVPAYSISQRALSVLGYLESAVETFRASKPNA